MANTLPVTLKVAKDILAIIKNNPGSIPTFNRDYESVYSDTASYDSGQTILIKKPPKYTARAGRVAVPQDTTVSTVPLTVNQWGVDLWDTRLERTLSKNALDMRLEAAAAALVTEIDRQGLEMAKFAAFNTINSAGTAPNTQALAVSAATDVGARLSDMGAPEDDRYFVTNPRTNGYLIAGMSGMFNAVPAISGQFNTGKMKNALGFDFVMSQNIGTLTTGAATATNINGAGQTGSALTVVAVAGGTLVKGTKITLPGVFAVNPQTRQSTGQLANFVVTADALVGATTINISPAIVTSGAFQNVTASPTTAQPYVILGAASTTYGMNLAYHRDAFTMAMVNMATPPSNTGATATQKSEDGITIKVTQYWDGANDVLNTRLDALFGFAATYPELAVAFPVI
jgi:P22 coat protein - gene protein 5